MDRDGRYCMSRLKTDVQLIHSIGLTECVCYEFDVFGRVCASIRTRTRSMCGLRTDASIGNVL